MNAGLALKLVKHITKLVQELSVSQPDTRNALLKTTWSALVEKIQTLFMAFRLKVSKDELRIRTGSAVDHGKGE